MKILAFETSTSASSIAITDEDKILYEQTINLVKNHNRHLLQNIDYSLKMASLTIKDLGAIAVSIGPGSFTGIRIGLSTAKGLAWASKLPLIGISTLDTLAFGFSLVHYQICPIMDARKGEVYCAIYKPNKGAITRKTGYLLLSPQNLLLRILEPTIFIGDGWALYGKQLQKKLKNKVISAPLPFHIPRASYLAALAFERIARGEIDDPISLKPLYVRPSEAELNWKKRNKCPF